MIHSHTMVAMWLFDGSSWEYKGFYNFRSFALTRSLFTFNKYRLFRHSFFLLMVRHAEGLNKQITCRSTLLLGGGKVKSSFCLQESIFLRDKTPTTISLLYVEDACKKTAVAFHFVIRRGFRCISQHMC